MSYLLSGLNIKNISEYNSSDAYNKYDVIDFQLHSQKSAYPNYTGFGETGLLFWFNNEYLNSFNLDLDNYITGWLNKETSDESPDDMYANLLQLSEDKSLRPFVYFDDNYIELFGDQFLSGSGFDCIERTTFVCFDASVITDTNPEQNIFRFDREDGWAESKFSTGPSGFLKVKGSNTQGQAKIMVDEQEFDASSPIYNALNIITLVQSSGNLSTGPSITVRQNGNQLGTYEHYYSGWTSGFLKLGDTNNPNGVKYYDIFSFSGVLNESEIKSYEKYLYESYFDSNDFYFAKEDVPAGFSNSPLNYSGNDYWTQDIDDLFKLSYGSSVNFSAKLSRSDFGDGYQSNVSRNINSLNSVFDLKYDGLTDVQAKCLIAFFETTPEAGIKNETEGFAGVNIDLFQPYKKDAELYFLDINHSTPYNDINTISIKAESLYDSNLDYKGMSIKLDEKNIRTYSDSLAGFEYDDVVYFESVLYSERGYYYYTGQKTQTSVSEENSPVGAQSHFTKEFYFKSDIDYDITNQINLVTIDYEGSTKQYLKDGINYNDLEFNLSFSSRSNKETRALLKFLDDKAGFKIFRYSLPQPYNKEIDVYCPEWDHTYNFHDNNDIQVKFVQFRAKSSKLTNFDTQIDFVSI